MNKKLLYSLLVVLTFVTHGWSQCNTNTSICTPGTAGPFNFVSPGPAVSSCLDWIGPNTGYIILHITQSGPLNMLIDGNSSSGFLDVSVFNIPAGQSPCTAIQNTANEIGCNYASASSGCNQFGTYFPCASSVPAPNVTAGQELMIIVENWSGSSSNFTLQLGPPPGAQTGPPNPAITPVGPFCVTSSSVQLIAADMGGTWSGPGVSSTGLFNPATAGIGTHTINYSIGTAPCNASSSTTITVNSASVSVSPNVTICPGSSTTLTASGAATYSWTPSGSLSSSSGATVTATPASTTTYTVTGTTAGCNSTANVTVTVSGNPAVNAVTSQSVCAGNTVSAINFSGGAAGTTYSWTNSNTAIGLGASGNGSIPAFTATNNSGSPITATITVTPSLGACTGTPITFTITVNGSNTTASPDVTICSGSSTTLTASGATSYSWSPSGSLSSSSGASVTATPASTTTYTVTGTTAGCSSTATVTVTVGSTPTMNPVPDQTFCAGDAVPSFAFSGGGAGTVYDWTNSNTAIGAPAAGTDTWPAFTATNPGFSAIVSTVTITPSVGSCIGTPETFTITVNPLPVITAGNNGPLCEGSDIQLTASNVAGGSYNWTGPNSFNIQNPTITGSVAADFGTYTVTVTAAGCSASATTTVVMNPGTPATITPAGPFCADASPVTLTTSVAGGVWSGNGITNTSTGAFDPSLAQIGNNTITYTPSNGCTLPATTVIVVNQLPVVQFSADVLTGCDPLQVQLTDLSVPASASVNWNFNDGSSSTQTGTVSHLFTTPGCYDISLTSTSAAGCSSSAIMQNYICVVPQPDASFFVSDQTLTMEYSTVNCINTSLNATSYSWEFGDGATSNLVNPEHEYLAQPGNFLITLYASNGVCVDSAQLVIGIADELIFHVPNAFTPDGDEYNNIFKPIFFSGFDPYNYTMVIYDRWGEILFETKNHEIGWDGTYTDQIAKEGIYTWTIRIKTTDNDEKKVFSGHVLLIR